MNKIKLETLKLKLSHQRIEGSSSTMFLYQRCIRLIRWVNRRTDGHRYIPTFVSFIEILLYAYLVSPNVKQMILSLFQGESEMI